MHVARSCALSRRSLGRLVGLHPRAVLHGSLAAFRDHALRVHANCAWLYHALNPFASSSGAQVNADGRPHGDSAHALEASGQVLVATAPPLYVVSRVVGGLRVLLVRFVTPRQRVVLAV